MNTKHVSCTRYVCAKSFTYIFKIIPHFLKTVTIIISNFTDKKPEAQRG